MRLSQDGKVFLATEEGRRLRPYNDALGHCTVGVGHLLHHGNCTDEELARTYTEQEVDDLLADDVAWAELAVNRYVKVPLTQAQFDALVSFTFNWGAGSGTGFPATSVLRLVNQGRFAEAADDLVHGHGPSGRPYDKGLEGVRNRRIREARMLRGGPVKFVSRDEAGLRASEGTADLDTSSVTVHWGGDGPGELDHSQCAGIWRAWQAQHMDTDQLAPGGGADIAYNAGGCQHGYVFEGRGRGVRSAANGTGAANRASYAVVYIGGAAAPFTDAGKDALNDAADWLGGTIDKGHQDWIGSECPGGEIYEWVHSGHPRGSEGEMTQDQANTLQWLQDVVSRLVDGVHPDNDAYGGAEEVNRVVKAARTHLTTPHPGGGGGNGVSLEEVRADLRERLS